jgi:hypothetical protein
MSYSSRTKTLVGATLLAATALGGCSDIYYDRRETIALGADDAVASNRVTQMVDPWPAHSANNNIAFNGERMQAASERYRQNKVTPLVSWSTSTAAYQQALQTAAAANTQMSAPAAPVK